MDIKFAPELGLKNISYNKPMNQLEPPVRMEVPIPGNISENRQFQQQEMAANALRPSQMQDTFKVKGNIVDFQA